MYILNIETREGYETEFYQYDKDVELAAKLEGVKRFTSGYVNSGGIVVHELPFTPEGYAELLSVIQEGVGVDYQVRTGESCLEIYHRDTPMYVEMIIRLAWAENDNDYWSPLIKDGGTADRWI